MAHPMGDAPENVLSEARALLEQKQPAEAARMLRLYLQRHPGTATDYMLLGVALSESGEGLMALETLEQAVALEPGNAVAHYNLGEAYQGFGRHREALTEWERALQLRPDYPAAARAIADVRRHLAAPPPASAPPMETPGPDAPLAIALLQADEIMRRERNKRPRSMIAVLAVLALGLIGLLVEPYLPAGVGLAIFVFEGTVVLPLVMWCVFWLQIQSLRRKEEEALRRGDTFDAAVAKADQRLNERLWRWR
jgi:tetratricopeptide (TPR) repeat protein